MRAISLFPVLCLALAGCQATIAAPAPASSVAAAAKCPPDTKCLPPEAQASPAPPAPSALPDDPAQAACMATFDAFNVEKDTFVSYDEFVAGRYAQIRWFKAPTDEEVANMKASLRAEAEKADADKDGKLSRQEFRSTCAQP